MNKWIHTIVVYISTADICKIRAESDFWAALLGPESCRAYLFSPLSDIFLRERAEAAEGDSRDIWRVVMAYRLKQYVQSIPYKKISDIYTRGVSLFLMISGTVIISWVQLGTWKISAGMQSIISAVIPSNASAGTSPIVGRPAITQPTLPAWKIVIIAAGGRRTLRALSKVRQKKHLDSDLNWSPCMGIPKRLFISGESSKFF